MVMVNADGGRVEKVMRIVGDRVPGRGCGSVGAVLAGRLFHHAEVTEYGELEHPGARGAARVRAGRGQASMAVGSELLDVLVKATVIASVDQDTLGRGLLAAAVARRSRQARLLERLTTRAMNSATAELENPSTTLRTG